MTTLTTTIRGLDVELDNATGSDPGTQCDVSWNGKFQASLAALEDTGVLCNFDTGEERAVSPAVISAITRWAVANGY